MEKEEIKFEEVVIAAWLHDVGKFAQRADIQELYNKESEGMYCKTTKDGRYTHQHVVYTEGFLDKYKDVLPDGINVTNVKNLAANHHNPSTYYDWIIADADRLSSGSDRCNILRITECKDESEFDEEKNRLKFYEKPMIHIFSTLHLDDRSAPQKAYCKMLPLENENIISSGNYKTSKEEYASLWKKFTDDFEKLKGLKYDEFQLSLNTLLERHWWCIPSATNADADISLYQHSKTTAAFAATLFQYHKNLNSENEQALQTDDKKFLFINGDMSGIQKYIFDLKTSSDNAKLLRAKSFQLWALSEIVAQYITKKFNVTYANIMTSAGGKFIILLPNTKENRTKLLPKLQLEIEEYFLKEFAGKLTLIISDGTQADSSDLKSEKVQELINKIGDDCDISKFKKMQKVLKEKGAVLETLYDDLQKNGECPKCGVFPAEQSNGSDDERQCKSCEKLIEIGRKLVKSVKIELFSDKLLHFGDMVKLYERDKDLKFYYSVNEYKEGFPMMNLPYVAPKFKYLTDEQIKLLNIDEERAENIDDDDLLTFANIANLSKGNKKLAMFKADIDNLGLVFSQSLGKRMSFSRYADLSHQLHYFFSSFYAWFVNNHSDENEESYKKRIYTVFSGGDDLCILGSWDAVMQFALDFQKEFCKFTNNNPSVTISGGIALVNSKLPVRNIAEEAESLLEKSKGQDGKNAVTVFGTTVSWSEYENCLKDGKYLDKMLKDQKLSTGVIYKFIDFANRAEKTLGKKNGIADVSELVKVNAKDRIWKSNMIYILARNVEDKDLNERLKSFGVNAESMIKSRIAVSYALYKNRKNIGGK